MKAQDLQAGQIVFFGRTEEVWNRPYVRKRHHTYDTRSVLLRGIVVEIYGNEFKAKLEGNNGFEKDGETFVFPERELLSNQDFKNFDRLGKWEYSEIKD